MHEGLRVSLAGSAHGVSSGRCFIWGPLKRNLPKSLCSWLYPRKKLLK